MIPRSWTPGQDVEDLDPECLVIDEQTDLELQALIAECERLREAA